MSVVIPLYPSTLLGYYFQLAALGVTGKVMPAGDKIILSDPKEYVKFVEDTLKTIVMVRIGRNGTPQQLCDELGRNPRLYFAGRSDAEILKSAGLKEDSWCWAAVSYVEKVKANGGPLKGESDVIALFRASMYGTTKIRVYDARGKPKLMDAKGIAANATIDSLGLGLLGGLASFMGTVRIGKNRVGKKDNFEHYLLPDGTPQSLTDMSGVLEVFYGATIRSNIGTLTEKVETLGNLSGLSFDNVTLFSAIVQAAGAVSTEARLADLIHHMSFDRYLVVRISTEMRPQVTWMSPLTISQIVREITSRRAEQFLNNMYSLARVGYKLSMQRTPLAQEVVSCVAECINDALLYFWSSQRDPLYDCARKLAELTDKIREPGVSKELIERAYWSLLALNYL